MKRFVGRQLILVGQALVAVPVLLAVVPLWLLPWNAALALGRTYGLAASLCYRPGWRTAQINLRRFHGASMSRAQARQRARQVFGNMGQAIAEGLQFARRYAHGAPGWDRRIEIEDPDLHQQTLADPRTKVFVTAHHGSWEMALMVAGLLPGNGAALAREIDNPFIDRLLRWARRPSVPCIDKRGGASGALEVLRSGRHVAMLLDENAGYKGVWVDFLGRPASTHRTAALLSVHTGSPIVAGVLVRRPGGRYLYRLAVVEPTIGPDAVADATRKTTAILARWVGQDPFQWRWIHWRWKTRPDGSEEQYRARDVRACFELAPVGERLQEEPRS